MTVALESEARAARAPNDALIRILTAVVNQRCVLLSGTNVSTRGLKGQGRGMVFLRNQRRRAETADKRMMMQGVHAAESERR